MGELLGVDTTVLRLVSLILLGLSILITAAVLRTLGDDPPLVSGLRERFVFGIPWGTVIVIVTVYAFYYLLQGGGEDGGPVVTGFRSWSLWYGQGTLFSSFAHSSESHLMGNLFGALTFAPIAEYAWRHYPERLDDDGWQTNPYARIALFVAGVFLVGLLGSIIVPGAIIGFSGVVFAFAGFALITFPLAALLAVFGISAVRLVYRSLDSPFLIARSQEQFVRPSWADIAVQGHLYGLVVGVILAALLLSLRDSQPNPYHVFFAVLVFAIDRSLHRLYWFLGGERFVLFQAVGTAGVFLLAVIVTVAVSRRERPLLPRVQIDLHRVALGALLLIVVLLAAVGIPYNLVSVTGGDELDQGIEVEDFTVAYAENVEDQYIASLDLPLVPTLSVEASGVIVASDQRNSWELDTSRGRLAADGSTTVVVGDATWRETVDIQRTTWEVAGSNTTYKVFGRHDGDWQQLFEAEPAQADPVINGTTITIQPAEEFYDIVLERDGERIGVERVPERDASVEIGNIRFDREHDELFAVHERTRVPIASFEF